MEDLKIKIEEILQPKLDDMDLFLVEVVVGSNNKIQVFADGEKGINIGQCATISRYLESYLDENEQIASNYNLEVSSPGMDRPLLVIEQFNKRINSTLKITTKDGEHFAMILENVDSDTLKGKRTKIEANSKKPKKKKPLKELEPIEIPISEIKKALLHFKF